jgi:hypothetical protein
MTVKVDIAQTVVEDMPKTEFKKNLLSRTIQFEAGGSHVTVDEQV